MTDAGPAPGLPPHILHELGFGLRRLDGGLEGSASVIPELHVPGADRLRTSVLAVWADLMTGLLAATSMGGRVPVTLELNVQLYRPAPSAGSVHGGARPVKEGRTVFVA
ncbi:MAG: hotdog domain-containing protein, partial [Acidimicrobiales bacterium]